MPANSGIKERNLVDENKKHFQSLLAVHVPELLDTDLIRFYGAHMFHRDARTGSHGRTTYQRSTSDDHEML